MKNTSKKSIIAIILIICLFAISMISIYAYQFGNNSATLATIAGSSTINGYIYTTDTSGGVGVDTTTSRALSANATQKISARIVGYPGVIRDYINYPGYISVSAYGSGGTLAIGEHFAISMISICEFYTPY